MSEIAHQDVMQLSVAPVQVREFLRDPERIADYYPDLIEYGTFEEGKSFWCLGKAGVALFEILENRCTDTMVAMSITTNLTAEKPFTVQGIKSDVFMTMIEEWDVVSKNGGSEITKTWLDVELHQMKELPIVDIIRETAVVEHEHIVSAWNNVGSVSTDRLSVE